MDTPPAESRKPIDWSGIRVSALIIGVREAARRAAANLTAQEQTRFVNRVLKRSEREMWLATAQSDKAQPLTKSQAKPMSANVINGADLLATRLETDNRETKLSLSRGIRRVSEHIGKQTGSKLFKSTKAVKETVGAASQLHGWEKPESAGDGVMPGLQFYSHQTVIQVNTAKPQP